MLAAASLAAPSLLTLLQSCQSEPRLDWQPRFFSDTEARFVSAFVDTILPRTDTPGALDVKVDMFLDKLVAEAYDEAGKQSMHDEIAAFDANCVGLFGNVFAELSTADRTEVLMAAEATSPTFNGGVWGTAVGQQEPVGFYRSMKSMAVWAYRSSEKVGTEVLNYDPVPGAYDGCVPVEKIGREWSL